jgi:CRISPR-associated protein Csm4
MEYLKIKIKPVSNFSTIPMSDTIFGQLIWILSDMGFDVNNLLENYESEPFLVVSDFLPMNTGNTPKIPVKYSLESSKSEKISKILERKSLKNRNRINIDDLFNAEKVNNDKLIELSTSLSEFSKQSEVIRCSINRLTGTTGNNFDPYPVVETNYYKNSEYYFYIYFSEKITKEEIYSAIEMMGKVGFGKDASLGKGQFKIMDSEAVNFSNTNKNSIYTLGNLVMEDLSAKNIYYEPFTRFGRHGNLRAVKGNPFKNPVVMALQGSLICFPEKILFDKPYIGKAVKGLSVYEDTVHQGYSLYIPVHLEEQ